MQIDHIYVNAYSWNWMLHCPHTFETIFCLLLPRFNTGWVFRSDFGVSNFWGFIQTFQRSLVVRGKGTLIHIFCQEGHLKILKKLFSSCWIYKYTFCKWGWICFKIPRKNTILETILLVFWRGKGVLTTTSKYKITKMQIHIILAWWCSVT